MSPEGRHERPLESTPGHRLGCRHGCTRWLRSSRLFTALALAFATLFGGIDVRAAQSEFPNPLDGPGAPTLSRSQTKKMGKAWTRLAAGRRTDAAKVVRKVADTTAGKLLALQIELTADGEAPIERLASLCASNPSYAAAWATLTVALEPSGNEADTLEAARRVAELWPESSWGQRASALESRWVDERVASARAFLVEGNADAALDVVNVALALEPASAVGLMTKAEALDQLNRHQEAKDALHPIAHAPSAQMLMARMAEEDGELLEAMQYYSAIPASTPGRNEALSRVKLEWRRQNLPAHVQDALASEKLTRAELAVVLVGLVPEANAIGGGSVPVLSDIVDLPSQREVVTVVRLGLMQVDLVQHQFDPDRKADPAEARSALTRLCELLRIKAPIWCTESSGAGESCTRLEAPLSGTALATVILQATHGGSP